MAGYGSGVDSLCVLLFAHSAKLLFFHASMPCRGTLSSPPPKKLIVHIMSAILRQSYSLNLAAADTIANAAIKAVGDMKTHKPMCVTVLDGNGGVLVQKRMDGCPDGAYTKFSFAKARTCIHLQTSSRVFREKYTGSGEAPKVTQAGAMVSVMEGELIPVAGGVLIKSNGKLQILSTYPRFISTSFFSFEPMFTFFILLSLSNKRWTTHSWSCRSVSYSTLFHTIDKIFSKLMLLMPNIIYFSFGIIHNHIIQIWGSGR